MHSLDTLPIEIVLEISSYLSISQKSKFSRTCKRINALIEPQIWTDIELHGDGYHETRDQIKEPQPFKSPSDRVYIGRHRGGYRSERLSPLNILRQLLDIDQDRVRKVASRVKSLCTVISTGDKVWDILPYFSNLEALELYGRWDRIDQVTPEVDHPPLAKLRFAKLLGYIPRAGARWILRSGPTLDRLELGMLDRPIATPLCPDRVPAPLPEENLAGDDESSDYGSLSAENTFPRPLGGFLPEGGISMPILRHLYLCSSAHVEDNPWESWSAWSSRAEEASCQDWMGILMASRRTLQTLVLEHKLTLLHIALDTWCESDCLRHFHENNDGAVSSKLAEVLEAVGVHKGEEFPELTRVYFYGIVVSKNLDSRPSEERPAGRVMKWLGQRGVRCEARRGQWSIYEDHGWVDWADWDACSDSSDITEHADPLILWDEVIASV
ncbi:F-box domain-containing protein [Fusarium sp. Ph1]|nr:F-box domain-containing protein [Fusarium sp. Ph1]